jgi:crotonobetainyl-CoA:carnitine CoA-transferase CaiB-like acyl-CoA transferase
MLCSSGWVHSDHLIQFEGRPDFPPVDQGQHGLDALYRLYECSEGWIFVAAPFDRDWQRLKVALGEAFDLSDASMDDRWSRLQGDADLVVSLSEVFALKPAAYWVEVLRRGGVSAAIADGPSFAEFIVSEGLVDSGVHPEIGEFFRVRPHVRFPDSANRVGDPCLAGEHTIALLKEREYGNDKIGELRTSGAVLALEDVL